METVTVKKITSKLLVGNTASAKYGDLYNVLGSAISLKSGASSYGEWTALIGQFHAWNDKHSFSANMVFLPEVATIPIVIALKKGETVDFGIIVSKVKADNAIGFEYVIRNIIPQKQSNQLEDLKERFNHYYNDEDEDEKIVEEKI
jgi:hypothetical protein